MHYKRILIFLLGCFALYISLYVWNDKLVNNNIKESSIKGFDSIPNANLRFLDFQKAILMFPVRDVEDTKTWIQGGSVNQVENELYITRQTNGGTTLTIERRTLNSGEIIDYRQVSMESGTYAEGLPWFINNNGELCFLVRQVRSNRISIFNYSTNKIEKSFELLGRSKIGNDIDKKYIVTTNEAIDTIYIYSFNSVIDGKPLLIHRIDVNKQELLFEKPQGITIQNNKVLFSHGANYGSPGISVVRMNGQVEEIYYFNHKSYSEMINVYYPNLIKEKESFRYENEGIFMFEVNGVITPALVQIVNNKTTLIILAGVPDGIRVDRHNIET